VTEAWPRRLGSSAWQLSDALPLPLLANESIAEQPADIGALTAAYLSFSREFVLSAARRAQPWFLFVSFHQPHVPLAPSPRFCNRSAAGSYGDALLEMDEAIGELGRIVSEAGAARSTLTLFASDNGPWVEMAPAAGSAGPLRGGKFTTYEGGIRVPALAHLPGAVPAGRVTAAVASLLDVLPTAVRLAGGTPRAQLLDGRDLRPLLSGRSEASPHRCLFFFGGTCTHPRRRFEWNQVPRPVGCALRRLQAALRHARRPAHPPGGEAAPLPRWEGRGRVETAPRAPRRRRARRLLALRGRALDRADQRLRRRSGGDSAGQQRSASRPQPARARLLAERHPLLPLLGIGTAALRPAEGAGQTPARLCRAQLPSVHLQPPQLARAHLRAAVAAMWPAAPARRRRV